MAKKFSFSALPFELKSTVLDSVHFLDSIQLFKTGKNLRQHYLVYGLFPKRINFLRMRTHSSYAKFEDIRIRCQKDDELLAISVNGNSLKFLKLVENRKYQPIIGFKINSEDPKSDEYPLHITSTIRSLKTLDFTLSGSKEKDDLILHRLFKEIKLFRNIHEVANFRIHDYYNFTFAQKLLLEYYCPFVENAIEFWPGLSNEEEFDFKLVLAKEQLSHCKLYHFRNCSLPVNLLSNTNADVYGVSFDLTEKKGGKRLHNSVNDFFSQVQIPVKNRSTIVVFSAMDFYLLPHDIDPHRDHVLFYELIETLMRTQEIEWFHPIRRKFEPIKEIKSIAFINQKLDPYISQSKMLDNSMTAEPHAWELWSFMAMEEKIENPNLQCFFYFFRDSTDLNAYFRHKSKNLLFIVRSRYYKCREYGVQFQVIIQASPPNIHS